MSMEGRARATAEGQGWTGTKSAQKAGGSDKGKLRRQEPEARAVVRHLKIESAPRLHASAPQSRMERSVVSREQECQGKSRSGTAAGAKRKRSSVERAAVSLHESRGCRPRKRAGVPRRTCRERPDRAPRREALRITLKGSGRVACGAFSYRRFVLSFQKPCANLDARSPKHSPNKKGFCTVK